MTRLAKKLTEATDTLKELLIIYLGTIIASGLIFSAVEHKRVVDSIWWAFVTATTVGYGDFYPVTIVGRIIAIVLMHIVPFIIAPLLITRLLNKTIEDQNQFTASEQEDIKRGIAQIQKKLGIEDDYII